MNSSALKIAVVGSGAVGGYYGGLLAHAGEDVHFLMRADLETVRTHGLTIHTHGETITLPKVSCSATAEEIGPVDLVVIALKTTANPALETIIPPLLKPETTLITLQNGLGNEEFLSTRWGIQRVIGGLCFVCLNRTAPGVIDHFDAGSLSIGEFQRPVSERVTTLVDAFIRAGINARAVENLITERWRKLLWNIPFNGLGIAGHGATVADVLANDGLRKVARDLMDEILDAARRLGHEIGDEVADHHIDRSYALKRYRTSSMIDWEEGRPVETEAIWGEPWRQGVAAGALMPRTEMLYQLIRQAT